MTNTLRILFLGTLGASMLVDAFAQCDGNHVVILQNFEFTPAQLTVEPGDSVSFINIEGIHTVNGVTNSVTGEPFGNPMPFTLPQSLGTVSGTCMGTVAFNMPGTYSYDCSVGFNAQAGMQGTIVVDAYDLNDLLSDIQQSDTVQAWMSGYAFQSFVPEILTALGQHTIFVPNDNAVNEAMDFMNLGQFDMLSIPDFPEIMQYHSVPGVWTLEDLEDGMTLTTVQGQALQVTVNGQGTFVDGARIVQTGFEAFNGVAHVIDEVLAPSGLPAPHVWAWIQNSPDHTFLEQAIAGAYLQEDLSFQVVIDDSYGSPGPWTVWAPTDEAFETFFAAQGWDVADLLSSQYLVELVQNHILQYIVESPSFSSGANLTNLNGTTFALSGGAGQWSYGGASVLQVDAQAYNGVVHVLDEVLAPEIEVPEGTCGVWTLELTDQGEDGWGFENPFDGTYVELQINQSVVDLVSLPGGNSLSYEFGVDVGDILNAVFYSFGGGYLPGYRIYDGEGTLVIQEQGTFNNEPESTFGLHACENPYSNACGTVTVSFEDFYGDGWDVGALLVFVDDVLTYELTMPNGQGPYEVEFQVNEGAVLDFIYDSSYFPQENGYVVYGVEGELLVDENSLDQTPGNALNVVPCPATSGEGYLEEAPTWSCIPNPTVDRRVRFEGNAGLSGVATFRDVRGRVVHSAKLISGMWCDLSDLQSGLYMVSFDSEEGITWGTQQLVVR
ncbi:MAG: fasciclin domain-containing protein [Flavobacteriales bacterium]